MRRKYLKLIMTLLIFTMCLTVLAPAAFAQDTISIQIPVSITLSGLPISEDREVNIILEADSPEYPMPLGSQNGIYRLVIREAGDYSLPEIEFSSIGIYTYSIYQEINDAEVEDVLDDKVYNLVVYITNKPDGSGLESMVMLYLLGQPEKQEQVVLDNVYEEEPEPEPEVPEVPKVPKEEPKVGGVTTEVPQTGDETTIWPYLGLFLGGSALLVLVGFTVKKKDRDNE